MARLDKLIELAKQETVPEVDVGSRVLLAIRQQSRPAPIFRITPFSIMAGLSGLAASIILFLAINTWNFFYPSNPPVAIFFNNSCVVFLHNHSVSILHLKEQSIMYQAIAG